MKKILSILLALLWLLPQGIVAFAGAPAAEGTVKAPQDPSTTYMKRWHEGKCMPSIGSVKLPVILVDFEGCRMDESFREACDNYFNAEYNPELAEEGPFAQSVRGAFQKLSYGRLDLTADILPFYHCEKPASAYNSTMAEGCALVEEIIASYTEQGILQKEKYDSDHDGLVDGVVVKFYLSTENENNDNAFGNHCSIVNQPGFVSCTSTVMLKKYSYKEKFEDIWDAESCRIDAHEIGHMMGLPDHYAGKWYTWIDYSCFRFVYTRKKNDAGYYSKS